MTVLIYREASQAPIFDTEGIKNIGKRTTAVMLDGSTVRQNYLVEQKNADVAKMREEGYRAGLGCTFGPKGCR